MDQQVSQRQMHTVKSEENESVGFRIDDANFLHADYLQREAPRQLLEETISSLDNYITYDLVYQDTTYCQIVILSDCHIVRVSALS